MSHKVINIGYDVSGVPTPSFVCDRAALARNLEILDLVQRRTGCRILLALKGFAMFSLFDQIREVLIHENYLSQKDIEICRDFDLAGIADRPETNNIRTLHEMLKSEYGSEE